MKIKRAKEKTSTPRPSYLKAIRKLRRRWRRLDALQLKYIMAVLMVLDSLDHIPGLLSIEAAGLFHVITRCVAAWFAFAAVESFIHTRSRLAYTARLFVGAAVMAMGNLILNYLGAAKGLSIQNNIFLTLGLGVLALWALADVGHRASPWRNLWGIAGATAVVGLGCIFAEEGLLVLPFMLITYLGRKDRRTRNCLYLLLSLILFSFAYHPYPTLGATVRALALDSDFLFITILPILRIYNGKRGARSTPSTLFFYGFYPAHLWIIQIVAMIVAR